jgi:hypothetical protein
MRDHAGTRADFKLIESACNSKKEWRFRPPDILSRPDGGSFQPVL